jgi:protein-L-isoaspartate(D-aspartate) O-methyltransferase
MEDSHRHKGLRKKLVEQLREKGISDEKVLSAINSVPRHFFMASAFLEHSYTDMAFPIKAGQTISQPYTVAIQSSLLEVKKGEKVLEIGTGSGYQTCVLLELGAMVYSVERQKQLYSETRRLLSEMGYKPKLFYGDGYQGLISFAPFDKILVTAGAPFVPDALKKQLVIGGKMIIPVGEGEVQTMLETIKTGEDEFVEKQHGDFRFVPLLEDKNNKTF